ncbi:protein of unknown function [Halobiforma haloterrestris]|uniref:Protein NO VEIN C-terminal domain-containing protein n=1 Tax=Natronobacterium haloterrestre TaxID=148448 RepID=A0A1I1L548_NATHA|nr:DUF3883 domain-containing protein [Halobiforma haloterrestris]SFC68154.1 protein of unknown function [Halobiforma haloterrestris]
MESTPPSEVSFLNEFRKDSVDSLETSPRFLHSQYEEESQNSEDYSRRFIYELIQNADDALGSTEGRDAVARFELTDDYLYVANTGRKIEQRDVDSLCTMGVSGKSVEDGEHETIGHKGRGFTSVLEITDRPAVYSTGISFRFDPERSADCLETAIEKRDGMTKDMVPVLCLPFPVSERPEEVDQLLNTDHHPCGFQTVFALELFDGVREQVERDLRNIDRELLLFLQNVERLEVAIGDEEFSWTLDRDSRQVDDVKVTRVSINGRGALESDESSEPTQYVVFRRPSLKIPERITNKPDETITHAEVGIALRYVRRSDGVHLRPFQSRPMFHVFLPTELQSPIPVQINGAFNTNMSREQIPLDLDAENQYNAFLLASALDLFPDTVLPLARDTATTASDLLDCFSLPWSEIPESAPSFVHEFAKQLREMVMEMEWLPTVLGSKSLGATSSLVPPADTRLPPGSDSHPDLARDIASLSSVGRAGKTGAVDTHIPHQSVLDPVHHTMLKRLGVEVVPDTDVPAMLEAAAADVSIRSYETVGQRRMVDPIIDILLRVYESHIDEEADAFKDACANAELFPIDSPDGPGVERVQKNEDRLFLPPEDGPSHLPVDRFQFFANTVYRPDGWTGSRGGSGRSDDFKADLQQLWPLDEFRFDTFAQGVIIPKLPSPGRTTGQEDVESLERLEVLELVQQLGVDSVDPESPLPYEQRTKTDLFPLCRLPVPTREGGWKPAHSVYFGAAWQSEVPEHGRIEPLLQAADIDASFVAPPSRFIDKSNDSVSEDEGTESDESSQSPETAWWEFLTWLGVREHVHLTPLFGPSQQQYYSEVKDFTAPDHPSALDTVDSTRWQEYREYLLESLDEYPFEEFSSKSLYSLHGFENIDTFVAKARADASFAGRLFSHLECWWETPPGGATDLSRYSDVVVGLNRTSYSNVIDRGNGIPTSQERHAIGRNLWLWQLRSRQWIPTDSGSYRPTAVWQESRATQRVALQLGRDDQINLLPVITIGSDDDESVLADQLGIRSDLDTELRPEDARRVVENLATFIREQFPDDERSERIGAAKRSIQTVYRNLTRRLPSTQQSVTKLSDEWEDARETLAETAVVAKSDNGFDLHPASETVFVRSDSAFQEARSLGAPTFLLSERDAGAFGDWFGLQDFTTHLVREIQMGKESDETSKLHRWLSRAAPYLLARLEADRPEQADDDLRALRTFVDNVCVVEELQVVRRLELDHRSLPEDATAVEFVDPNEGDELVDIYDGTHKRPRPLLALPEADHGDNLCRRAAKLLCDHVAFPNVEAVLLAIQSSRNGDLESYARYADLDDETVDRKQAAFKGKSVSYGFDDVDPTTFSGTTSFEQEVAHTEKSDAERVSDDSIGAPTTDSQSESSTATSSPSQLYEVESLALEGTEILEGAGERPEPTTGTDTDDGTGDRSNGRTHNQRASPNRATRDDEIESVGTDLVTVFEAQRLKECYDVSDPGRYIFDVSQTLQTRDPDDELLDTVLTDLAAEAGISKRYPGFDLLIVHPESHEAERLIEIKASTGDNGRGSMTLNEWRTAECDSTQQRYWLYVVGNLSVDAAGDPFIRRIENPAKVLYAREEAEERVQSKVRVHTADFEEGVEVKETRYTPKNE